MTETWLEPQRAGIPILQPSAVSAPFWAGCDAGELRYQRCTACGTAIFNPAHVCRACTAPALEWQVSAGRGAVYSYTICYRPLSPQFTDVYAPVIVDLEEGYQMLSNVVGCEADAVHVGMPVRVSFHDVGDRTLPYFQPA